MHAKEDGKKLVDHAMESLLRCVHLIGGVSSWVVGIYLEQLPNIMNSFQAGPNDAGKPAAVGCDSAQPPLPCREITDTRKAAEGRTKSAEPTDRIQFVPYKPDESQLPVIMHMIAGELSEPYSIYTYRYFLQNWPELCILAVDGQNTAEYIGVIICKMERESVGYIAMLAVEMDHRRKGIGTRLVEKAVEVMEGRGCDEVGSMGITNTIPHHPTKAPSPSFRSCSRQK